VKSQLDIHGIGTPHGRQERVAWLLKVVGLLPELARRYPHEFSAAPVPGPHAKKNRILLTGDVPSPVNPPAGCSFHPRCRECRDLCSAEAPVFRELAPGRWVVCHNR
jgi:oligopeptide/dipeptide ABC transporter ATP-binding protein